MDRDSTGGGRVRDGEPWWLRPQVWAALLIVAAIGMAVLLTGCGSSGSSPSLARPKKYQKALAFVQCMRTHGEPTFPDPTSQGIVSDSQANIGSPVLRAAGLACAALLPPGSLQVTEAQQEQFAGLELKRAECMRAHGVTNFPDPSAPGQQGPPPASAGGIGPSSPVFQAAARACDLGPGRGPRGPGPGPGG
ncbi:MAG TPA: hypothetical protein VG123_19880 [Streptosporangiaceae bacterium]|jgi:hypothetical protein|nr:hypothetical protein [Streptosporangiaceae bacterium]